VSDAGTPLATYRLQLGDSLDLAGARRLVPYLQELGVSHLYLSPVLQARSDSTHGYDVVDPRRISEQLGGEAELRALCTAGLGVICDVVPNHMATSDENPFWRDLELRRRFFDLDEETGRHRRFFDIDELAGVRVEDPEVFETTHRLVLDLVAEGLVDGLRIDHPDGLADPRGYFERLRSEGVERVWVEKILEAGERLPDWPVEGATGYDFADDATGLFVDPAGEDVLTDLAGERRPWREVASEGKLEQATTTFRPEVDRLRRLLDFPELEHALASLPVYRTYVEPWSGRVEDADREALRDVPEPLRRVLLLEEPTPDPGRRDEFVTRFQQLSGAVMAKGVEDTAFYRYIRLVALNEVGNDPGRFGVAVGEFHQASLERARRFPRSLLAGTTHDTKRSADVRGRIGALAGMAERWRERVLRWRELNEPLRSGEAPDWTEELLIYQTLVGAWPLEPDRLEAYIEKALREAKRNTSWVDPDLRWEEDAKRFCRSLLEHRPFLDDFEPFAEEVAVAGEQSAIGQLVLRLTAPGVPDLYNGEELWYLALVDPDNRRPIDFDRRRRYLDELVAGGRPARETVKLHVIRETLALRRRHPDAFEDAYEPLPAPPSTCAYRRGDDVIVAVPVRGDEPEVELPPGRWSNVLQGVEGCLRGYRPALWERLR
jgi:(1->4)-alpha-D-glucan 1-alpha-D-glucosylmutase